MLLRQNPESLIEEIPMQGATSERGYFLVQVSERGSINILRNSKYINPRWASKPRDRAHGLVKPGGLLAIYFAGGARAHR